MRVLFITDLYPPFHVGGHELRCRELAEELQARGHCVLVLTSAKGSGVIREAGLWRVLTYSRSSGADGRLAALGQGLSDAHDARWLARALEQFNPELAVVFGVFDLSVTFFSTLSALDIPVVYDEGSFGLERIWKRHGPWLRFCSETPGSPARRWAKKALTSFMRVCGAGILATRRVLPEQACAVFNSHANLSKAQTAGVRVWRAVVIHTGVNLSHFPFQPRNASFPASVHLLVPGRIHHDKGQLTVVQSLPIVSAGLPASTFHLRLLGREQEQNYAALVRAEIERLPGRCRAEMVPLVPREEIARQYQWADVVVSPAVYEEPFARVPLEAMASGRPLVSTATGGAKELVQDGRNALIFEPGDVEALTGRLARLCSDVSLYDLLAHRSRRHVEESYNWTAYVDRVERFLQLAILN